MRSYAVLGDQASSEKALADARKALAASPVKLALFEDAVKEMNEAAPQQAAPAAPAPVAQDQGDTIRAMVQRLADRLKLKGDDPDGWLRLVKSYGVLGDKDKVDVAIADARKALAGDSAKLAQFDEGLKALQAN